MLMKTILIPLAAFAVTVTGASAFNADMLKRAGLNDEQIAAFEEAKELKEAGDKEAARDVLLAAGVDEKVIKQVREAMRESMSAAREAIESGDYAAFSAAVEGSPLAEIIDSEAEFDRLVEAHALLRSGDHEAARDIFEELGFPGHGFISKAKDGRAASRSWSQDDRRGSFREEMKDRGFDGKKDGNFRFHKGALVGQD